MAEHAEVIVIGGGQAGLAAGYYLAQARIPFLILDADASAGDSWRRRWDSLELFTAARYSALPGLPFPGDPEHYPGKDAVADYIENYARMLELPIRHDSRVTSLEQKIRQAIRHIQANGGYGRVEAGCRPDVRTRSSIVPARVGRWESTVASGASPPVSAGSTTDLARGGTFLWPGAHSRAAVARSAAGGVVRGRSSGRTSG